MKTQFKYLLSNLLLVGLTGTMFATTGCPAEDCTTDADCAEGEVCNTETAACEAASAGCADDSACTTEGERCLDITDGVGTCRAPANCSEQADPNGFCNAATAGQVCEGTACVTPAPTTEFKYILIKDVSTGASACDSNPAAGGSDPGSDIMWAVLLSGGEIVGSGKSSDALYTPGTSDGDPNTYNKPGSVLTGMLPSVDNDECPTEVDGKRFRDDSVVSLGCGGSLFVEFVGSDSMVELIQDGYQVQVGEYAPFCNQNGGSMDGSDRYEVYLCETEAGAAPTAANCATKLTAMALGGIMTPVGVTIAAE